jgi:hypothetical protein
MRQNTLTLLILLLILYLFPNVSSGQKIIKHDTCPCNYNCWPNLNKLRDHFNENQMRLFLRTFSIDCIDNAEFEEFGNETLFYVLDINTELFIQVFENQYTNLGTAYILNELREPIHENVNVNNLIKKVNSIKGHTVVKGKILKSLRVSEKK